MRSISIVLFLFAIISVSLCAVTTRTWRSSNSGNFNDPANYLSNMAPASGEEAILNGNGVGSTFIAFPTGTWTPRSLTMNGVTIVVQNGATLNVGTNLNCTGVVNFRVENGGTLTVSEDLRLQRNCVLTFTVNGAASGGLFVDTTGGGSNAVVSGNTATGNYVVNAGARPVYITNDFTFPARGMVLNGGVAVTFNTLGRTGVDVSFDYTPALSTTWTLDNSISGSVDLNFRNGVTFNTGANIVYSQAGSPNNDFQLSGAVTTNAAFTLVCSRLLFTSAQSQTLTFNGAATLGIQSRVSVSTGIIAGTGAVNVANKADETASQNIFWNTNVVIENPNFNIVSGKKMNGASSRTVTWQGSRTLNQVWELDDGINFLYEEPLASTAAAAINGSGVLIATTSYNSGSSANFDARMRLRCPLGTFTFFGSSFALRAGLDVEGCVVSQATVLIVRGTVTTINANSTLPAFSYDMGITFAGSPTTPIKQIEIPQNGIQGTGQTWNINDLVLATTGDFAINANNNLFGDADSHLLLRGTATFTITTGSTLDSDIDILVEGTRTFTAPSGYQMFNNLVLREATVGATSDFRYLDSNIWVTSGVSTINSNNFVLKNSLNVNLVTTLSSPPKGWLQFTSADRTFEASVTARTNVYVSLTQNFRANSSLSFTSTNSGSSVLLASGATVTTVAALTFNGNTTLQGATNIIGGGSATFSGNNLNLWGNLNAPNPTNQVPVLVQVSNLNLRAANLQMGSLVDFRPSVLNDNDSDNTVPSLTLTLLQAASSPRDLRSLTLNANLVVQGNARFPSSATFNNDDSTLTIQGSSLMLAGGTVTFNSILSLTSTAVTVTANSARTLSINSETFNVPGSITVIDGAVLTFNNRVRATFTTGNGLLGDSTLNLNSATFVSTQGVVTFAARTINVGSATFIGSGFVLNPIDQSLNLGSVNARAVVTYPGNEVDLQNNPTTIQQNFVFSASPNVTFQNNAARFTGDRTISNTFIANGITMTFADYLTLDATGQLAATNGGSFVFETSLGNAAAKVIDAPVTLGTATGQIVSVATSSSITFAGNSLTVNSVVQSAGGSIISSRSGQTVSGNGMGVLPAEWTWSAPLEFGTVNITGARTLTRVHTLTASGASFTRFLGGLTLNAGAGFISSVSVNLGVEQFWNSNVNALLSPSILLEVSGDSFSFGGSATLTTNGTFSCRSAVNFVAATNVIFGWINSASGNAVNFYEGCSLSGAGPIQFWRNTVVQQSGNTVVNVPLIFGLPVATVNVNRNGGTLLFNGDINLLGLGFNLNNPSISLGSITFTSAQNATLTGIQSSGVLTFNSAAPTEPRVFFRGSLDFTINLMGPVLLPSVTLVNGAAIEGTARVAFLNSIIVSGTILRVSAPSQIYVDSASAFTFSVSSSSSELVLNNPSLFNPLGFGAPDVTMTGSGTVSLSLTGTIADFTLNGNGFFRLTGGTMVGRNFLINNNGTLWQDGVSLTLSNLEFTADFSVNPPVASNLQVTIDSATTTPITVTGNSIYQGVAVVIVRNFNWDGNAREVVTSATSANSNFLLLRGPPSFNYVVTRQSDNDLDFSRTAVPTAPPAPTQSVTPNPAVSGAVSNSVAFLSIFVSFAIYFIFN